MTTLASGHNFFAGVRGHVSESTTYYSPLHAENVVLYCVAFEDGTELGKVTIGGRVEYFGSAEKAREFVATIKRAVEQKYAQITREYPPAKVFDGMRMDEDYPEDNGDWD